MIVGEGVTVGVDELVGDAVGDGVLGALVGVLAELKQACKASAHPKTIRTSLRMQILITL
jgi:hypothetical protein